MFVYLTNTDGLTRLINLSKIETVYNDSVKFTVDSMKVDSKELEQITTYLEALKLIYQPSEPMPPVGEPLREIVGEAFQEFMNTKGRTD
jgi:hypothetical protein